MEFQWGRIAERRPNLLVEPAHIGLAHRLGREAVQLDCLVIEPEISRQVAFIPALTRLFNTARNRIHCFLLSRSLNSVRSNFYNPTDRHVRHNRASSRQQRGRTYTSIGRAVLQPNFRLYDRAALYTGANLILALRARRPRIAAIAGWAKCSMFATRRRVRPGSVSRRKVKRRMSRA